MARPGLSFGSPTLQDTGLGLSPRPSAPFAPSNVNIGPSALVQANNPLDTPNNVNLAPSALLRPSPPSAAQAVEPEPIDPSIVGRTLTDFGSQFLQPPAAQGPEQPRVYFSQSTGRMHVGDFTFNENNASDALRSRDVLGQLQADAPPPQDADDWRALDPEEYAAYLDEIENPDLQRIAGEGFQTGMRGMGEIYNAALLWAGVDEANATRRIAEIQRGHERDAPFQRNDIANIHDGSDLLEFAVASIAQTGPWLIESAITAGAGALAGSAVAPGPGTISGAATALAARGTAQRAIRSAVGHYAATSGLPRAARMAAARTSAARAGEVQLFDQGVDALTRLAPHFRTGGAVAGVTAGNIATGVGDTYNEMLNEGVSPDDADARGQALVYGMAYAGLDTATDVLMGAGLLGKLRLQRNAGVRIPTAAVGGAAAEGATEAAQEAIITHGAASQTGQPWGTEEHQARMLNAAAAGAIPGAGGGAIAGVRTPQQPAAPAAPPPFPDFGTPEPATPAPVAPVTPPIPGNLPVYGPGGAPIHAYDTSQVVAAAAADPATFGTPDGVDIPSPVGGTIRVPQINVPTETMQQQELPLGVPQQPQQASQITPELNNLYVKLRDRQPLAPEEQAHLQRLQATPREQLTPPEQFILQTAFPQSTDKTWQTAQPAMRRAGPLPPKQQEPQQGELPLDNPNPSATFPGVDGKPVARTTTLTDLNFKYPDGSPAGGLRAPADAIGGQEARDEYMKLERKKVRTFAEKQFLDTVQNGGAAALDGAYKTLQAARAAGKSGTPLTRAQRRAQKKESRARDAEQAAVIQAGRDAYRTTTNADPIETVRKTVEDAQDAARETGKAALKAKAAASPRQENVKVIPAEDKVITEQAAPETKAKTEAPKAEEVKARARTTRAKTPAMPEGLGEKAQAKLTELRAKDPKAARLAVGGIESAQRNKEKAGKPRDYTAEEIAVLKAEFPKAKGGLSEKIADNKPPTQPPGNRVGMFDLGAIFETSFWKQQPRTIGVVGDHHIGPQAVAQQLLVEHAKKVRPTEIARVLEESKDGSRTVVIDDLGALWALKPNTSREWAKLLMTRVKSGNLVPTGALLESTHSAEMNVANGQWAVIRAPVFMDARTRNSVRALVRQLREANVQSVRLELYPFDGEMKSLRNSDEIDAALSGESRGSFRLSAEARTKNGDANKMRDAVTKVNDKLFLKAKVTFARNAGELPSQDAPLYLQMKAAFGGSPLEFEAAVSRAQGYSFIGKDRKPQVVLFTDNIESVEQAKFVFFHEMIGHVGMRAFVRSDGSLGIEADEDVSGLGKKAALITGRPATLEQLLVWAMEDPKLNRRAREYNITGRTTGQSYANWVEEVMADMAGEIETSTLKKIWYGIKDVLNKLGFEFDDDLARWMLSRMRRYVKYGDGAKTGNTVGGNYMNIFTTGRFRTAGGEGELVDLGRTASTTQDIRANLANRAGVAYAALQAATKGGNFGKAILDTFRTQDDAGFKNRGVQTVLRDVFAATNETKRSDVQRYQDMMPVSQSLEPKPAERAEANDMLNFASLYNHDRFTYSDADDYQLLNIADDGTYTVNKAQFEKLKAHSILTPEQFNAGIEWRTADGTTPAGTYKPKQTQTKDSVPYKIYLEHMEARFALELDKLQSYFMEQGGLDDTNVRGFLNKYARGKFDEADVAWFKRVQREFYALYYEDAESKEGVVTVNKKSAANAENFLEEVLKSVHSAEKRKDWTDKTRTGATREIKDKDGNVSKVQEYAVQFRDDAKYDDIISGMDRASRLGITSEQQQRMLSTYQNLVTLSQKVHNAETSAIMSIGRGHVPLVRRGDYQMRVSAFDDKGNQVRLDSKYKSALPYALGDTMKEMQEYGEQIQKALDDTANKWTMEDEYGNEVTVTLRATWSAAETTGGLAEPVSVESFLNIASSIGIGFNDAEMRKIVRALSAVEATIRKRVQRAGTPGFDPDASRALAEMFDRTASSNAKRRHGFKLPAMLLDNDLWLGSKQHLDALQKRFDRALATGNEYAIAVTEQDLTRYAWQYAHSAAAGSGAETFTITTRRGEREYKFQGQGNKFREQIKELARFYRSKEDIDNPEDLLSGSVGSNLKVLTVASTLGGSVLNMASGIMNLTSLYTNTIPYLAYTNKTTGFGLGSGMPRAAAEVAAASANMIDPKLSEPSVWEEIVDKGTWAKHGLRDADEALFMREFARRGLGDAAMTNQFLGTARNKTTSVLQQKALDLWMGIFSGTEQFNRRVTGLATYRLHRARMLESGEYTKADYGDINSEAFKATFEETRRATDTTQGQHDMWNRPAMFRGNILGHVFMFKQFVVNSIQLIGRLPPQGQMAMLALYVMMSGLKGLPFGEDIMDLIDTLMQKLGIRQASVELWLTRALDEIAPGVAPYVMYGLLNQVLEGTVSSRVGLGDVIPFTGVLREGADVAREIENAIGPAFGTALGWGEWGALSMDGAAMVLGLKDPTMGIDDWLRHAPVSAIRSATETGIFALDGTITNQRGQIVSEDVSAQTVAMRALGFYPTEATLANNIVRLGRIENMYVRSIKADYVNAWARARRRGQTDVMRRIEADVAEWNRRARAANDDQFVIRTFQRDALRSAREGDRTATERFSRTGKVPEAAVEDLIQAYGMN